MEKKYLNRVELHCHSGYSSLDSVVSVKDAIRFAKDQGMSAIAFTDHENVMAFPEIQHECTLVGGIKPIYGVEGYVVNDLNLAGTNLSEGLSSRLDTDVVAVYVETTGPSPLTDEILMLTAVKIDEGEKIEQFCAFVKPSKCITPKIQERTDISDEMLVGADSIDVVLPRFLDFVGDRIIVGHNVKLDLAFIEENADSLGLPFEYKCVDTLVLSRLIWPKLESYGLGSLIKACGLVAYYEGKPVDGGKAVADLYLTIVEKLASIGKRSVGDVVNWLTNDMDAICKGYGYHTTILARNMEGVRTIYKLVTDSNLKYYNEYHDTPLIRLSDLLDNRDNLIIGSSCEASMLGKAIRKGKSTKMIEEIASFYDFFEVQPESELLWTIGEDCEVTLNSENDIRAYTDRIIELGEKMNKPVVATGNVHFLRPENAISWRVLRDYLGFNDLPDRDNVYFRTTDEMLAEFAYLGEEKAYEIVVENSNLIANQIEYIKPLDCKAVNYNREGDYEKLEALCFEGLRRVYGESATIDTVSEKVRDRLLKELWFIKKNESAYHYLWFYELINDNGLNPAQYNLRGSAASMLVNYLLHISHVNPLDVDVPLYSEFFQGIRGDKHPDIDMNFDSQIWAELIEASKSLSGIKNAYRASTVGSISERKALGLSERYSDDVDALTEEQKAVVRRDLVSVTTKRGLHPGGMLMVPESVYELEYAPLDITEDRKVKFFQFEYHSIDHIFEKMDILSHEGCSLLSRLYDATGYYPSDEDIRSKEILDLLTSCEGLGVPQEKNYGINTGLLGIPGLMSEIVFGIVNLIQPQSVADLVKIEAMLHGTGTWNGNGEELFFEKGITWSDFIGAREDVFEKMLEFGMDRETALAISEEIRKGKMANGRMKPELREAMASAGVPDWYIKSCEKIRYLFPRAHCAEYVQMELRMLYYKLHYPDVFYPLYFEIYGTEKFKEFYSKGEAGFTEMVEYFADDKTATVEDMLLYKTWNEYRMRLVLKDSAGT